MAQDPGQVLTLPERVSDWPAEAREWFAERAAILEFDAGLSRSEAERQAETLTRNFFLASTQTVSYHHR
jgi:hypothetical protein